MIIVQILLLIFRQDLMESPLGMQFNEFDADKDGRLNDAEAYQLLKLLGKNVYQGTVRQIIKHMNYLDPENKTITFNQFKEYFDSFETQFKHQIWKYKYQVLYSITELTQKRTQGQGGTAAPGSGPGGEKENPVEGSISIQVGPQNMAYTSSIQYEIEKKVKEEAKPFLKIVFEQNSAENAKKLEQKINSLYKMIIDLLKGEFTELTDLFDSIHVITNVSGNKLNIFVTTSNELLIEVGELMSEYFDKVLSAPFDFFCHFKHEFNLDIPKLLDPQSSYTFYEAITKNTKLNFKWMGSNFKKNLKEILKVNEAFSELWYDKMDPPSLMLVALLHLDVCQLELVFENSDFTNAELESKNYILEALKQISNEMKGLAEEKELNTMEVLKEIDNKIFIEASLGNWNAKVSLNIKDLNKILTTQIGELM